MAEAIPTGIILSLEIPTNTMQQLFLDNDSLLFREVGLGLGSGSTAAYASHDALRVGLVKPNMKIKCIKLEDENCL
jgi:hypothetical protein